MAIIRFGRDTFASWRDVTLIGVDEQGGLVFSGDGPLPKELLVWLTVKESQAFLNADLADSEGEPVLQIRDNVIRLNHGNVYDVKQLPENQIPPTQVLVTNSSGETAMDLRLVGGSWEFNGDFYHGDWHVVATPDGTTINPRFPNV